jgi:hypothetical protein
MQTHTANDVHTPPPVFIRMPRYGQKCPHTGLSRSSLDLLTRPQRVNNFRPPVKSRLMRQTGTSGRTIRLIDFDSLVRHLIHFQMELRKTSDDLESALCPPFRGVWWFCKSRSNAQRRVRFPSPAINPQWRFALADASCA